MPKRCAMTFTTQHSTTMTTPMTMSMGVCSHLGGSCKGGEQRYDATQNEQAIMWLMRMVTPSPCGNVSAARSIKLHRCTAGSCLSASYRWAKTQCMNAEDCTGIVRGSCHVIMQTASWFNIAPLIGVWLRFRMTRHASTELHCLACC